MAKQLEENEKEVHRHYTVKNLTVIVNVKRSKEDLDLLNKEAERLHHHISQGIDTEWAKERITGLHNILLVEPLKNQLKSEIEAQLKIIDKSED